MLPNLVSEFLFLHVKQPYISFSVDIIFKLFITTNTHSLFIISSLIAQLLLSMNQPITSTPFNLCFESCDVIVAVNH